MNMHLKAPAFWETKGPIAFLLWPIALIYGFVMQGRKYLFDRGFLKANALPVPIIFVGNIRVGGTGKTPCLIALAQALYWAGFSPGVNSRGYRSSLKPDQTKEVTLSDSALDVGDEPKLLGRYLSPLQIPVWIGANRQLAGIHLLQAHKTCNVIISDDGLSHYSLSRYCAREGGRDIELVVRDARREGNTFLLPAGPLREPSTRARDATLNISMTLDQNHPNPETTFTNQHYSINCVMGDAYQLIQPKITRPLRDFKEQTVLAVAGIAHPEKFFAPLRSIGIVVLPLTLGDHADYSNIAFDAYLSDPDGVILMTEKDAVKCSQIQDPRIWVVPLVMPLPKSLLNWITQILHRQPDNQ